MKYVYPAVFSLTEDDGFAIWFPDLPGTNSQGKSWTDAIDMARNSLCSWIDYLLDKGLDVPHASSPQEIVVQPGEYLIMISNEE